MAPRLSFIITISTILAASLAWPVASVRADGLQPAAAGLPTLETFAGQLANGEVDQLRGLYAPGLFADRIVPQPAGAAGFVASEPDVLTQFGNASQLGAIGLLAHNYLAGKQFSQMGTGQIIYLVYGDGHTQSYAITGLAMFQALQPNSDYSSFIDLATGEKVGAFALFTRIYDRPGSVVLQTCIAENGISTWGRLFVIAEPYTSIHAGQRTSRVAASLLHPTLLAY